jgi:hypothetical protein
VERYCPLQLEDSMDRAIAEKTITIILTEIHLRLDEAARIAKAAEACALAGSITEGVTVSMDIEQIIYETGRLQDAASLLNRLSRE